MTNTLEDTKIRTRLTVLREFMLRNREDLNIQEDEIEKRSVEWLNTWWFKGFWWHGGQELHGFVALSRGDHSSVRHVASLRIAVDKDHWNQGIGSDLMFSALQYAKDNGIKRIEATPYMPLDPYKYHLFIDKGGFEIESVQHRKVLKDNQYIDILMLVKHL